MTPLEREIERLQDAGHDVWIRGWTSDGRRALVIAGDNVCVASQYDCNGVGRWECSRRHLDEYSELYYERFPCPMRPTVEAAS